MPEPEFDVAAAHRFFAADCFNKTWDLMDKPERTAAEDRLMVALTHASLYHWSQRADCTEGHFAIGYWQVSRVYALLGNAPEAKRFGDICLSFSSKADPFLYGYAHEALARAALVAGDRDSTAMHKQEALTAAERIQKVEDRDLLLADLKTI
jgi:hypothetical protein